MGTPTTVPSQETVNASEISPQERLNGASGEELAAWRLEGKLPPTETERKGSAEKAASQPAEVKDKTEGKEAKPATGEGSAPAKKPASVAASAAAKPQKSERTNERFEELFGYLRQEREARSRLEAELAELKGGKKAETKDASPASKEPPKRPVRPKMNDLDEKGQPKFKMFGEYEDAVAKYEEDRDAWRDQELERKSTDKQTQTDKQKELQAAEKVVIERFSERVKKSMEVHTDWREKAQDPKLPILKGSPLESYIFDSEMGAEIAYYLGQHPEEATRLTGLEAREKNADGTYQFYRVSDGLTPVQLFRELAILELSLTPDEESGKKTEPAASAQREPKVLPTPPTEVSARRAAPPDDSEAALRSGNIKRWLELENAKDIRMRKARA